MDRAGPNVSVDDHLGDARAGAGDYGDHGDASAAPSGRRPWVRRLWRVGGTLLAVPVLVQAAFTWVTQVAHEEYAESEVYDAAGIEVVEIRNLAGRVHVVAGPPGTEEIAVAAEVSDGLQRTRRSRGVEDDRLLLDATCPFLSSFCNVVYEVEMPPDIDLVVRTQDGRATVSGLEGQVEVDAGGAVEARSLSGPAVLRSDHSAVEAVDITSDEVEARAADRAYVGMAEPPAHLSARASFGGVEVVVPDDGGFYRVDATVDLGSADTASIRHDPDSERVIEAHGTFDVTVRYR